jgi:monofunctional chorismate mutase
MNSKITSYRSAIDELDRQIVSLLKKRFQLARELAVAKKSSGIPVMDHERELSILEGVSTMSSESPDRANLVAVFRQILQESRAVQLRTSGVENQSKRLQSEGVQ